MRTSWDAELEKALSGAEHALDKDDFEAALDELQTFELPKGAGKLGDPVSLERMSELRRRYDVVGERMRSAQKKLQATMERSSNSRRAARAYGT